MEVRSVETIAQVFRPARVPSAAGRELVFVGRSNVGKSSLVNRLLRRRNLARVSKQPGKTRGAFFYAINGGQLVVVDLPGYGFARGAHDEQAIWEQLSDRILSRPGERVLVQLIDVRHSPQKIDLEAFGWFGERVERHLLVGTKSDKLKRGKLAESRRRLEKEYGQKVLPVSSEDGSGIRELWKAVDAAFRQPED